jgi:transposase
MMLAGEGDQQRVPRHYSQELRDRVIAAVEGGPSEQAAARPLVVSASTAVTLQCWRWTGSVEAKPMGGDVRSPLDARAEARLGVIATRPASPWRRSASSCVRKAIEAAKARLLYPPPLSPDPISIEQAFAKLKALLQQAAERSIDVLWQTIGRLLDCFKFQKRRNYLRYAGYAKKSGQCSNYTHHRRYAASIA